MYLLYDIRILAVDYFVLSQCTRLTDRQTDRHTHRCPVDSKTVRTHSPLHGKNGRQKSGAFSRSKTWGQNAYYRVVLR